MKKIRINKNILIIFIILAISVLSLIGVKKLGSMDFSDSLAKYDPEAEQKTETFFLYSPDYDTDIMTIPEYLGKNLYIRYTNGGETFTVVPEEYSKYGAPIEFFGLYFDTLKAGDTETLNALYSDKYFEDNPQFSAITMQKIYDINVEYISHENDGNNIVYLFRVSYKIMKNDGTFRSDLRSDAESYQYYRLEYDFDNILITSVSKYTA